MSIPVEPVPSARPAPANLRLGRLVPLGIIALVSLAVIGVGWFEGLSPVVLIERRGAVDAFVSEHWIAALAAFAGVYAIAVALSLPGGALLTVCGGVIFGGLAGGLAALIGATAGATAIFLIAKSALGDWLVHRAGRRTEVLAAGFCADAFNYLLFLRLVPVFPFWLVNLVPALCGVRLATYVGATVIGIIPATFAFAYFGAGLDSAVAAQAAAYRACLADGGANCRLELDPATAATPQLIAALVTLGVLALIPVAVRRFKAAHARPELASHPSKTPSACPKSSRPTSA
ncbi:MAG TPA: VTT domain-containing protein [Xanthobacteraceae bacterium]|nr:VTT domain-containing protein [Xanthobacteraceae bacterium]